MNQLEQTIVANAHAELASLLHFYQNRKAKAQDSETTEAVDEHLGHYYALNALLVFGHQANSGMSEEGMQALRMIEEEHAAALRKLGSAASYFEADADRGHTIFFGSANAASAAHYEVLGVTTAEAAGRHQPRLNHQGKHMKDQWQFIAALISSLMGALLICTGLSFGIEEGFGFKNSSLLVGGLGWITTGIGVALILQKKWNSEVAN